MRLFVAIDLKKYKDYFKNIQNKIPKEHAVLRFTDSFHLTLKFLGEIKEEKIPKIKKQLNNITFESFKATLSKIGFFPKPEFIRVIWVGFKQKKKLTKLQNLVDNTLSTSLETEKKFHPHVTLARVKNVKNKQKFQDIIHKIEAPEKTVEIENFKLLKSTLTPNGPIYETIATIPK